MLILTRQKNQSVMIGDDTKIIVLGLSELGIILGFDVPRHIPVHREEIYLRNKVGNLNQINYHAQQYALKNVLSKTIF